MASGLSEQGLLAQAGETIFGRGEEYVRYVHGLVVRDQRATASIQARNVYVVELDWSGRELAGSCSCPFNSGGEFCKHLVAVGLAVIDAAGSEGPVTSELDRHVDAMSEDELRAFVRVVVERDPAARRLLEVRAAGATGDAGAVADDLVEMVRDTLATRGYVDYRRSFDVAKDAQAMLDELEGHLAAGGADLVRPALLRAVTRLRTVTLNADDSSGSVGDACQRAAELYARSCVEGHPDRVKVAKWLVKFRDESPGWPQTTLPMFVEAFDEKALAAYRRAVTALDKKHQGVDHWKRSELDEMLLELADHDGDVDRAVDVLAAQEHPEYVGIVERLRAAGRDDEALAWIDRAVAEGRVTLRPQGMYWLDAVEVARLYAGLGRHDDALAVLRSEFDKRPGRASYLPLLDFAAELGRWDEERAWALARAREQAGQPYVEGAALIEILLGEGDLEEAWRVAKEYGAGTMWEPLAAASAETHPLDAASLYRPRVEEALTYADTQRYPVIAERLAVMRDLHERGGAAEEFAEYVAAIRQKYGRRTSLMAALDRTGL